MNFIWAKTLGAFVRWLFKGCRTKLKDEIEGNLDSSWAGDYDIESYIVGFITIGLVMTIINYTFF